MIRAKRREQLTLTECTTETVGRCLGHSGLCAGCHV